MHDSKLTRVVIPYVDLSKDKNDKGDMSSTMASTLPMAAASIPIYSDISSLG